MEIVTFTVFSELLGPLAALCKSTRHRHGPLNLAHIFLNLAPPMSPAYSLNLPHTKDAPHFFLKCWEEEEGEKKLGLHKLTIGLS